MRKKPLDREGLARQLASLPNLDREALKDRWEELFGRAPPERVSQSFLQLGIAYRLQEKVLGGLGVKAERILDRAMTEIAAGGMVVPARRIKPGTRLLRDWQGVTHEVIVLPKGVLYAGEAYRSLSEVACVITGAHWSGPAFFGLNQKKRSNAAA